MPEINTVDPILAVMKTQINVENITSTCHCCECFTVNSCKSGSDLLSTHPPSYSWKIMFQDPQRMPETAGGTTPYRCYGLPIPYSQVEVKIRHSKRLTTASNNIEQWQYAAIKVMWGVASCSSIRVTWTQALRPQDCGSGDRQLLSDWTGGECPQRGQRRDSPPRRDRAGWQEISSWHPDAQLKT